VCRANDGNSPGGTTVATVLALFVWLVIAGANMWVGVAKAGYSVAEELPVFAVIFIVPAAGRYLRDGSSFEGVVRSLMSADPIAEMSPMVREVFEAPSDGMCATFEIVGNPDAWAQVTKSTINAAYPLDIAPESHLLEILAGLPGSTVADWEANTFVTLTFELTSPKEVAKAVDRLFRKFFDVGEYSVDCRVEDL
jgi:hypothetical protein